MEATFPVCGRGSSGLGLGDEGIGGGGRLVGLADGFGGERERIGVGRKRGDALGEAGLEERVGGGGGGRLEDLRSDEEEEDLRWPGGGWSSSRSSAWG